ncbi:hypothetical protein Drose_32880 [Dactylosporangium roseum]|uniref:Helicase XPB/Ssl2 N-terminal domain-containing protein n=1 Tax=Dactylosporangium roseum TaxID=47989 RepID=A0ABY5Z2K4_9ACTN|nr:hypothetical protein [Dactylosporangium roseum]UWZ35836.1 hypothetical protein Drose_32880 [Dactylosporangium roseum]
MTRGALVAWLRSLDADELGEVLRRRPDALAPPVPADLTQLAARLSARSGLTEVVAKLPLPALQVIEAMAAFPEGPVPLADLAERLGSAPDDTGLDATLRVLTQRALVWPDGDRLWAPSYLLFDAAARQVPDEPFEPVPPAPPLAPADRTAVRAAAGAAAAELLDKVAALLDEAAARPPAQHRDGGVAARELARLGVEPLHADLVLAAGLLGPDRLRLRPTTACGDWHSLPPADQLARLLGAWWSGPALRQVVVRTLHDLPPDTAVPDPAALAPLVRWTAPLPARQAADLPEAVDAVVAAATLLGVCALGAISPLGRALADSRPVADVAAKLLPEPPPPDALRVRAVGSVVLSDDPELLDDVVAALRLHRLAPTVASSPQSTVDILAALRAAGYRPARDGGAVTVRRARPAPERSRSTVDAAELARRLLVPSQRNATPLEQIRHKAPQLRPEQARLLADAIERGTPVRIRYVDAAGRSSDRVIDHPELAGSVVEAWCRLRRDDRAFALDKIVAVALPRPD